MSCAACVAHVEHSAKRVCGKDCVTVSLLTNSLTVTVDDGTDEERLYLALKKRSRAQDIRLSERAERKTPLTRSTRRV